MDELKQQIKECIISSLELEDITPENIVDSEPLFGTGLGLDSIDALELGVEFNAENSDTREHFASVNALAEYISSERAKAN